MNEGSNILCTDDEMEAFHTVVTILIPYIRSGRITYIHSNGFFVICIDNDENKQVCRLDLKKCEDRYLIYFDENKREVRKSISTLDDISGYYSERLIDITKNFR